MMPPTKIFNDRKSPSKQDLEACAYDIADKYEAGSPPEIKQIGWTAAWKCLMKDLRNCCPGFSEIEYGIALNKSFVYRDKKIDT